VRWDAGRPPSKKEQTARLCISDEERTRPFVKRREVLAREVPPEQRADGDSADDLDFDRPIFVPRPQPALPPPPPDTRETIDMPDYDRLVAATRPSGVFGVDDETPPWPGELPQTLFEEAGWSTESQQDETYSSGPSVAFNPGDDPGPDPVLDEPRPLTSPLHPMEATQQPGISPPSVAAILAYSGGRRRLWLWMASAVVLTVAIGALGGVLVRCFTTPRAPADSGSGGLTPRRDPPPVEDRSSSRERRRGNTVRASRGATPGPRADHRVQHPTLQQLLQRASQATAHDEHEAAHALLLQAQSRSPDDLDVLLQRTRSSVELGLGDALGDLSRSRHPRARQLLPLLRIRLAVVRKEWRKARRLLRRLPRRARFQPRSMVWMASIWRGIGRLEDARHALQRVLQDHRLIDDRLRAEAQLQLSEILLECNRRADALTQARQALAVVRRLASTRLMARVAQQVTRCEAALDQH